ncbi:hypothetical protein ABZZ36_06350 [Actinacidiphila glaucinigra]|uniref:hypothetical protein n=1 Tax=Actinacidiphila glaucinigra TaxID=235986 RepID=UPI00339FA394
MRSVPWAVCTAVPGLMALGIIAGIVLNLAGGYWHQVLASAPFSVTWLVGLGFAIRAAGRKALGRKRAPQAGGAEGWRAEARRP